MKYLAYLAILVLIKNGLSDPVPQENSTTTTTSAPVHHATECELSESSKHEKKLLERLNKLKDKKFTWEDDNHKYFFSICSQVENASFSDEAFVQIEKNGNSPKRWVLGRLNDVDLEGFEDTIRVNYKDGDEYAHACNKSKRNTVVYIKCDQNKINPEFSMVEENNDRSEGCAYIFLLKTKDFCSLSNETTTITTQSTSTLTTTKATDATNTTKPTETTTSSPSSNSTSALPSDKKSKLGILSIILIALTALLAVYFIFGVFYMRFVNQATGWEQIPNFGFWNAIGERSADLCNLICRCGNRRTEIHTYENINDHVSDDENLLNM